MSAVQYPSDFPLDQIKSIVDAVRSGEIGENLDQLAYDIWVVQGYAQSALLGDPTTDGGGDGGGDDPGFVLMSAPDKDAAIQALEALVSDDPTPQVDIPWDLILSFLFKLLEEWLSNR